MSATVSSDRPELFLKHQDGTPVVFYLISRIPEDWAIWIRSHGGSVATRPTDAQFVIFPESDLLPRESQQLDAFKSRDIPTVRLQWLVRMRGLGCMTNWARWAMDPTYHTQPLVEYHELAVQLRMLGVDNIQDESVNLDEIFHSLSRRFPHHPMGWFEAQLRRRRPDDLSTTHQEVPESPPVAVTSTAPPIKVEPTMWYLPTPTSLQGQQSQSQSTEDESLLNGQNRSTRSLEELFQTPRSNISEAANNEPSLAITPTRNWLVELGSEEEEQDEEGGIVPGSAEDGVISDGPIMGVPTPIPEQRHSPTALEPLFQGGGSPFGDDYEMDPLNPEFDDVLSFPPMAATNEVEAAARLLHGIDDLSNWEPTPSIYSYSQRDRAPPTFDNAFGLWCNSSESMERHEGEENTLYKEFDRVQANRVLEEELQYGWELLEEFIQFSTWMSPAQLGRRINRLFGTHGGRIDWVQYLGEEPNHRKIQDTRQEWRKVHWRVRNPDADEEPPTDRWFTFGQASDPGIVRASPPEVSDDECDKRNLPRSRPKNRGLHASTSTRRAAGTKRKRAGPGTKPSNTCALASSSSAASSSSFSSSSEEDLSDSESSQEHAMQGRRIRRRLY